MIASLRNPPVPSEKTLVGPQHIGHLLSQVLARYGIVITASELESLYPSKSKTATGQLEQEIARWSAAKMPLRRIPRRRAGSARSENHKMAQLPLFSSADGAAVSSFAAS
jgi:hypothetical protein